MNALFIAILITGLFTVVGLIGTLCEPRRHRYPEHTTHHYGREERR